MLIILNIIEYIPYSNGLRKAGLERSTKTFFTLPPLEDREGESPRLYLPPEADTLKLLRELTDGLLAAELVTSDDISSPAVYKPVKN
jgi:hypothetical protein